MRKRDLEKEGMIEKEKNKVEKREGERDVGNWGLREVKEERG